MFYCQGKEGEKSSLHNFSIVNAISSAIPIKILSMACLHSLHSNSVAKCAIKNYYLCLFFFEHHQNELLKSCGFKFVWIFSSRPPVDTETVVQTFLLLMISFFKTSQLFSSTPTDRNEFTARLIKWNNFSPGFMRTLFMSHTRRFYCNLFNASI